VLPPEPGPVLVNKGDLASILGVTVATVSAWIARHPDFPVHERGTQGREWRFDAGACVAFVTRLREAERQARAEQAARVAQLGLPLTDPGGAESYDLAELKAARLMGQVRAERAFLVEPAAVAEVLAAALTRWDARVAEMLASAVRDLNLPAGAAQAMAENLAEARHRFAAEAAAALGAPGSGPAPGGLPLGPSA
jgi:phage terminase Nu1 subunit (DNA packaging protein)